MKKPLVTVLMAVYNGQDYLREAIESILNQTYSKLEFLIINDGSTDQTDAIIRSYKSRRIRYISNAKNQGLDVVLNKGFLLARGEYIARMDADDISLPSRIEEQVAFLETHSQYGAVGTYYANMDENGAVYEIGAQVIDDEDIKLAINNLNVFCHGSMMIRTSLIRKHNLSYDHAYYPLDDYELWTRMVHLAKVRNLPKVLYLYRINPKSMMHTMKKQIGQRPQKLNNKLQRTMKLPEFNRAFIKRCLQNASSYQARHLSVNGKKLASNMILAYQTHLYKLGLVYLKRKKIEGFVLFIISFTLRPSNWFKKFFSNIAL